MLMIIHSMQLNIYTIEKLIESLEYDTALLLNWFRLNEIKSNNDNCHLIIINNENNAILISDKKSPEARLLNCLA